MVLGKILVFLGLAGAVAIGGGAKNKPASTVDRGYTINRGDLEVQDQARALNYALEVGQTHNEAQFVAMLLDGVDLAKPLSASFRAQAGFVYELLRRALGGRVSVSALSLEQANLQLAGIRDLFTKQGVNTSGWLETVVGVPKAPKPADLPPAQQVPPDPPPVPPANACAIDLGDYMFDPGETTFEVAAQHWGFGTVDNAVTLFRPDEGVTKDSAFLKLLAAKIAADPFFVAWGRACAAAGFLAVAGKLTSPFKDCWGAKVTPPNWTLRDRAGALLSSAAATQVALAGGVNTASAFGQEVAKYEGPAADMFNAAYFAKVTTPMQMVIPNTSYYGGVASNLYLLSPEEWRSPASSPGVAKFLEMDSFFVTKGEELAGVGKADRGIKFLEVIYRMMWTGSRNFAASVLLELA